MKIHQLLATVNSQKILENDLLLSKIMLSQIKLYRHVHNNKLQKFALLFVLNVKIFIRKFDKPSPASFPWDASVFDRFSQYCHFNTSSDPSKQDWQNGSWVAYRCTKHLKTHLASIYIIFYY